MEYRFDVLFFVDVNLHGYKINGEFSFCKTRKPETKATGSEILLWVLY